MVWKVRFVALITRKVIHPLDPLSQIRTSLGSVFKIIPQLLIVVLCVGHVTGGRQRQCLRGDKELVQLQTRWWEAEASESHSVWSLSLLFLPCSTELQR